MNFLRRIYLLLLGLLLVIVVTLLLMSPQAVGTWVGSISELSPVIRLGLTLVIDLFLLLLMYLQVRPDPGSKVNGLVMRGSGAITEVSVESARDRILKAVSDVPDVVSAEAKVEPVRGRADIELQVAVFGPDVKLPAKQKEINRALRQVIDKQLGLQMAGQPRIHLRIHGEAGQKPPLVATPPPVTAIEKEPAIVPSVQPLAPVKAETVAEQKPSAGLFGGLGSVHEPADTDVIKPVQSEPISVKPEPESEPSVSPLSGLFSSWRRDREDEEAELVTPVESAPDLKEPLPAPPLPPEPVAIVEEEEDSIEEESVVADSDKAVKFDFDEEFSHSVADDFVDDEPESDDIATDDSGDTGKPDNSRP